MRTKDQLLPRRLVRVFCVLGIVVASALLARPAYAADYSIDKVDIDATVQTDGSVDVTEQREFTFDGSFHGVYWEIPKGEFEGRDVEPQVVSAGEYVDGSYVAFENSPSGLDGTYSTSDQGSNLQVKIYSAHADESVTFVIQYHDMNLASRWADTSELYWKFVSDGWDVESLDVTCTIHLPVPTGASIDAGSNVRAWGHGPLDASLSFDGDGVVYSVPGVGTDEYAEARIVFPQEWLSDATASSEDRLDSILSEEQQLADEANARRLRARIILGVLYAACAAVAVASVVIALREWKRYRDSHRPLFQDKYFRDVPSQDHPAVLGALLRDGKPAAQDFSASLMRLTDLGYVTLDQVVPQKSGLLGKRRGRFEFRLTRTHKDIAAPQSTTGPLSEAARIDRATERFVFETVARRSSKAKLEDGSTVGKDQVLMSDFERVAKASPQAYSDAYDAWQDDVFAACVKRGFFVDDKPSGKGKVRGWGAADLAVAVVLLFASLELGFTAVAVVEVLAAGVGGALCLVLASRFDEISSEAIEIRAKLEGLRNWLCDFTRLKEAWPRDFVLWNRLLVMAVVLGVADRVIDQLKVAAPEMLQSDAMAPVYGWYYFGGPGPSPLHVVGDSFEAAHSVSTAALAQSSMASASGGGGGFSGGGGGGFGGGGGGGAF